MVTLNTRIRGAQLEDATISGGHLISSNSPTDGYILKWDGTNNQFEWAAANSMVANEAVSGDINGSNTIYTLSSTPVSGSVMVFLNGLLQEAGAGNDYTLNGDTITMLTAPLVGDILLSTYLTIPVATVWVSHFDNNDWSVQSNCNWDGSKWVESGPGATIVVNASATWEENYRPTQMRITGTPHSYSGNIRLLDGLSGNVIGSVSTDVSPQVLDLDWQYGNDMVRLDWYAYSDVTNIEFS